MVDLVPMDGEGVEVLAAEECVELLAGSHLGRIALTIRAVPAIFPVRYQMVEGQIVFRAGKGTNLYDASVDTVVAFEVDDVDRSWAGGWSVLVVGIAREVTADAADVGAALERTSHLWESDTAGRIIAIVPGLVSGRRFLRAA
jgi:nitroimidazol reductase NimA-like FMN-containing flavoprotein (pyridoxamine 5'-phosphate oxidase superfamily)